MALLTWNGGSRQRPTRSRSSESEKGDSSQSNQEPDLGENGHKEGPPQPVGFWDPRLNGVRNEAFRKWGYTTLTLVVFILAVLSLYWGVFFHLPQNFGALDVFIVDMDGAAPYDSTGHEPLVGPTIVSLTDELVKQGNTLNFQAIPASRFDNDPVQVRQAVYDWDAWAAVVINPNATALLYSAIQTGNKSYDPLGACQFTYADGRDDTNFHDFILPIINPLLTQAQASVGENWAALALENVTAPGVLANIRAVPQALNPAIGFSQFNLRPFYPETAVPAVTIGLIYLIILSFFSYSFYMPVHAKYVRPEEGHPPLKFWQLVVWRWLATLAAYLFLSLAYSIIPLAFQINFSGGNPITSDTQATVIEQGNPDAYGHGTFVVYWMLNYLGMIALGLACENVAMTVGQPWTGLWLIFWVITNVSTSFYDVDVEPGFYRWGYAWPLHNIVHASRQILFDLHSEIGVQFGVLVVWAAINTVLFPFACYFLRWKHRRGINEYWA